MKENQLEQYSRQILLPNFDIAGQQNLLASHIVIVGLGGLGNIAASYLAAAGVGQLTLIDDDQVELSNLPRQVLYRADQIGLNKVAAAQEQLQRQNPDVIINVVPERMDEAVLLRHIESANLVIDCTDNFSTRQIINRVCWQKRIDLVTGAAIRWQGQLQSFLFSSNTKACYQCLYPDLDDEQLNCSESGVIGPVVGMIGVMLALDALKIASGCGIASHGQLRIFDAWTWEWRTIKMTQDPECQICTVKISS